MARTEDSSLGDRPPLDGASSATTTGAEATQPPAKPGSAPDTAPHAGLLRYRTRRSHSEPGVPLLTHQNIDGAFGGSFGATARPAEFHTRPWFRRSDYFVQGWRDPSVWRAAAIELAATSMVVFLSGQWGLTLQNNNPPVSAYVGVWNAVFLAVFIYATAPASGGHLNPTITLTTVLCGLCPVPRGVLYIVAQSIGGALGGGILRGSWGYAVASSHKGGGNFFDPSIIQPGNVLLIEIYSTLSLLFLAVGTGIDPRQQTLFGPYLGPSLVGLSFGMVTAATTNIAPGYTGANMNPARALALAIAGDNWDYHWIWWVGPIVGSILLAALYNTIPPSHAHQVTEKSERATA